MEHRAGDAVQEEQETAAPAVSGEGSEGEEEVAAVEADDEGYRTPTSLRHRLRPPEECPPAPALPRVPTTARKARLRSGGLMSVRFADLLASWCHRKDSTSHPPAFMDRRAGDGVQEEQGSSATGEEAAAPSVSDDASGVWGPAAAEDDGGSSGGYEGEADDEGYRTPASPRHRLRTPEVCPSPPWPRRVPTSAPHGLKRQQQPEHAGEISARYRRRVVAKKSLF